MIRSRDSSVDTEMDYRLDGPGLITVSARLFSTESILTTDSNTNGI